jgi:hypothetical protein
MLNYSIKISNQTVLCTVSNALLISSGFLSHISFNGAITALLDIMVKGSMNIA